MSRLFRLLPSFLLAMLCLMPVSAVAADWVVSRATKQVTFTIDKRNWVPVAGGMTIPNGSWVSTGPRGRVVLQRGVESIAYGPDTLAAIFTENGGLLQRNTNVVQKKGSLALDIEKRGRPHTYVHTPFLAAVVKGTSFEVRVTARDASVSVEHGLVQVSSFTGGQSTNLGPGQQATVDQSQRMSVSGISGAPSVRGAAPGRALLSPVGKAAVIGADVARDRGTSERNSDFPSTSDSHSGQDDPRGSPGGVPGSIGSGAAGGGFDSSGGDDGADSGSTPGDGAGSGGSGSGGGSAGIGGGAGGSSGSGGGAGGGAGDDDEDDDDDDDDDD
nr:membrane protein [Rhizobium sp. TCK]